MKIKLLQLNMWAGMRFSAIAQFLKQQDFDVLCFQEVAGPHSYHGNVHCDIDCFASLQQILPHYKSELIIDGTFTSDPINSYEGNAIFYKDTFTLKAKNTFWLKKLETPFSSDAMSFENMGRSILHLSLEKDHKECNIITTHLAWANTKTEQPHQREQNKKLISYMSGISKPWILTGDFNILDSEQSILDLEKLGRNLGKENNLTNTIDPMHKSWERFKPGTVIDYIFVSPDIKVNRFEALENVHMSDHLGLVAELEI